MANPFEPAPRYRTSSPAETAMIALDLPMTPLNTMWQGIQQGTVDSFGLGSAIKDFATPRGATVGVGETLARQAPAISGPLALYEGLRGLFGAKDSGKLLDEDSWKQSEFFRDGITWDAGMTEDRAAAIAMQYDQRMAREYFGAKNMPMYLLGSLLGQIPDPVNYVPVFGPGARLAAQAKFGFVAGHALIGASEAAINTAVFGAITTPFRGRLGEDVSWEAAVNNIAFASIIGAAFGGLGGAWGRMRSLRAMRAENEAKFAMESVRNLQDARDVLGDAVGSLVETGEVRLSPKSQATLERMTGEVIDRRMAVRALDAETAGVTGTKVGEVAIAPGGARVAVRPEVVEASTLQRASGALQVRDRSADNLANVTQVQDIALNLDPAKLMPSIDAGSGAPIVGPDNVVDSGNGRVAAINLAYDTYPDRAAAYRAALVEAGYPEAATMDRPVLVSRRTTDLSPEARAQFNAAANSSTTARMSAVEIAAMDRAALTDGVLDVLDPDLPITAAGNRAFVGRFLAQLPVNESTALYDKGGNLSADGVRRIENALVAAAYGDADMLALRKLAEATDDNTRAIVGAMADVAGHWLSMRRAIKRGDVRPELDATPELTEALRRLSIWREQASREGRPVGTVIKEGLAQGDMLSGDIPPEAALFIRSFYRNDDFSKVVSREKIAGQLRDMSIEVIGVGQPDMLGEAYAATKLGVMQHVYANDIAGDFLKVADDGASLDQIGGTRRRFGTGESGEGGAGGTGQAAGDRSAAAIADDVAGRLSTAGRPKEEAQALGTLVGQFYRNLARAAGMTVDDLVSRFGLPDIQRGGDAPEASFAQSPAPDSLFQPPRREVTPEQSGRVLKAVNARIAERVNAEDSTRAQTIFASDDALVDIGIQVREGEEVFPQAYAAEDLALRPDQMTPSDGLDGSDAIVDGASLDPAQVARVIEKLDLPPGMTIADLNFHVFDDVVQVHVKDLPGLVDRLKADAIKAREVGNIADLDTLNDHAALAAGFREYLDAAGIPYRFEDRGSSSNYFEVIGLDGNPVKIRFADHARQSIFHEDADVNVAPGVDRFSDAVKAATTRGYEQEARGLIRFGNDGSAIIHLLETADPSTALHEMGHHWLFMLKSMADADGAPLGISNTWGSVTNWWRENIEAVAADAGDGITAADVRAVLDDGTTGDPLKDIAVDRGLQEQWARGIEAYMREGQAPTPELAGVFERFKQWLVDVYRSLADLNVKLSPEIRQVFDRLLGEPSAEGIAGALDARRPDIGVRPEPGVIPVESVVDVRNAGIALKRTQAARSMDELYAVVERHQADLDEVGQELAAAGLDWRNPGIKKRATTEQKMARKGYKSTAELTDVVRGGFVVHTPADADAVVAALGRRFRVLDEGWNITEVGYFDRKLMVQFADGTIGEVQIWHPDLLKVKQGRGHALYEEMRALTEGDPRRAALEAEQKELYLQTLEVVSDDWLPLADRLTSEMEGKPTSGYSSSNAAGDSLTPESITSAQSQGSQAVPPTGMNHADTSRVAAGRPSQSNSLNSMSEDIGTADAGSNAEYFDRPQPVVDMQEPELPLAPDGLDAAAARVGKPETLDMLAEQFGVDRKTGDFAEAAEIEAMRAEGRLTPDDLAELEAADRTAADADAFAETLRVAAACVMG